MTEHTDSVSVRSLTPHDFAPFGWVLGKPLAAASVAFENAVTDFRSEHVFAPGAEGRTEVLWVRYRNTAAVVRELEVHHLTEQAIVPLDGDVLHVVALSDAAGAPDMGTLAAFVVGNGTGICMRPGVWHATRVKAGEVTCLMLTRQSTTRDLIAHLKGEQLAVESAMQAISPVVLAALP